MEKSWTVRLDHQDLGIGDFGAGTQMISVVPAFNSGRFQVYLPS